MIETWYAIVAFMLVVFVVLDGMNMGAGMLSYLVGKNFGRRTPNAAWWSPPPEPFVELARGLAAGELRWDIVPCWRSPTSSPFPFFRDSIWRCSLLLWALVRRGISIEVGGHASMIRSGAPDGISVFVALQFPARHSYRRGAAGNVVARGFTPLQLDGKFAMAILPPTSVHTEMSVF